MNRKFIIRGLMCFMLLFVVCSLPMYTANASASAKTASVEAKKDHQLRLNGKGSYVTWFQRQLKKLGYYTAGIGNKFTTKTVAATKLFQQCNNLPITGKGDSATRALAFSKAAITRKSYDIKNYLTELKRGASGAQVTQLQSKLIEFGYPSSQNGKFDTNTYFAVRYFQSAHKLTASGVATRTVRLLLNAGNGITAFDTYAESEMGASCKKGYTGLRVAQVQTRLKELGYYKGKIDGAFSETLRKSYITFEKFNNFSKADGVVSASERTRLHADTALSYSQVAGSNTVKPGTKSRTVLRIQAILWNLKYYKGPLDSKYTSKLVSAVKRFQKAQKLYPTGICYSPTLAAIYAKDNLDDSVDPRTTVVVAVAKSQLGKRYRTCGHSPSTGYDCSGFTYYVYRKAVKKTLGQSSSSQARQGALVASIGDVMPGDLVFFATGKSKTKLNHVGICISNAGGNPKFIHASSAGKKVITSTFRDDSNGDFYRDRFLFARRIL